MLRLLLADVAKEENCLPLLEFALTALWEQRDGTAKMLTVGAYDQMGGLKGALNKRATAVYERLRTAEQVWAKRICLQLVRIGWGDKDTRQRQPRELLLNMGGQDISTRQVIADVISDLVKGRILVVYYNAQGADLNSEFWNNQTYIELSHEALLDGWKRLLAWRQEDRAQRRLLQRLEDAYEEWKTNEKNEQYLLSGGLSVEIKDCRMWLDEALTSQRKHELEVYISLSNEREKKILDVFRSSSEMREKETKALHNLSEPPLTIFIAHASEDKQQVLHLYSLLKERGYEPWVDKINLMPGQNWRLEIPKVIKNSDIFLACFSNNSVQKKSYVQREYRLALSQCAELPVGSIFLIPLRFDECEIPDLRHEVNGIALRDFHRLDYWEDNGFERLIDSIEYIRKLKN